MGKSFSLKGRKTDRTGLESIEMTRLKEDWIRDIETQIEEYDQELSDKIGMTLLELAASANGIAADRIRKAAGKYKVAAVPVMAGEGIIGSFSQSVAAIIGRLGFKTFVTEAADVDGIYEAFGAGATCLFLADDQRFIGINRESNLISDNNTATAKGYITALEQAAGDLEGRKVLVLGHGTVGKLMVELLTQRKALLKVYDIDATRMSGLDQSMILESKDFIKDYQLILDATNNGDWITEEMLHKDFWMAAPGVPLSLSQSLFKKYRHRVIHDRLQIGVAVMMGELCR
jgi:pyrrolysine biosynthesis protein PylD